MSARLLRTSIIASTLVIVFLLTFSVPQRSTAAQSNPRQVTIDVYMISVGNINQQLGSYNADMYVSFAWYGNWSATNNNSSSPPFPSNFQIINGQVNSQTLIEADRNVSGTGYNYDEYRLSATLYAPFNFQRFPLDKQTISVTIEDSYFGNNSLIYVSDNQSDLSPSVSLPGWVIQKDSENLKVSTDIYNSTFAYPGAPIGTHYAYSSATFSFHISRPVTTYISYLALPTVLLIGMVMITFRIKLEEFEARLTVGILVVFTAVAFMLALDSSIPAGYFTLADEILLFSFAASLYSIALTVRFHRYNVENLPRITERIDKASFVLLPIVVFVAILLAIF